MMLIDPLQPYGLPCLARQLLATFYLLIIVYRVQEGHGSRLVKILSGLPIEIVDNFDKYCDN